MWAFFIDNNSAGVFLKAAEIPMGTILAELFWHSHAAKFIQNILHERKSYLVTFGYTFRFIDIYYLCCFDIVPGNSK
jgi:hypothetical protein